jgi:hypothetical protein
MRRATAMYMIQHSKTVCIFFRIRIAPPPHNLSSLLSGRKLEKPGNRKDNGLLQRLANQLKGYLSEDEGEEPLVEAAEETASFEEEGFCMSSEATGGGVTMLGTWRVCCCCCCCSPDRLKLSTVNASFIWLRLPQLLQVTIPAKALHSMKISRQNEGKNRMSSRKRCLHTDCERQRGMPASMSQRGSFEHPAPRGTQRQTHSLGHQPSSR